MHDGDARIDLAAQTHIGLTSGTAFCGLVGAAYRCEYSVMGPSVNLAARLMSQCALQQQEVEESDEQAAKPGEIAALCDEETSEAASGDMLAQVSLLLRQTSTGSSVSFMCLMLPSNTGD